VTRLIPLQRKLYVRRFHLEAATAQTSKSRARVKVLDPLTSLGPSMEGELLSSSASDFRLWVPRWIIPGSAIQILISKQVVLGKVWFSTKAGTGFEIEVAVES
jgi:hypothetical protein